MTRTRPTVPTVVMLDWLDLAKCDVFAIADKLCFMIRDGAMAINSPRQELREPGKLTHLVISPGCITQGKDELFGARIYAAGLSQSDEYQAVLLYDANGLLQHVVLSQWISAFRTAVLARSALAQWSGGQPSMIVVSGLGRMSFVAAWVLMQEQPVCTVYIVRWRSRRFEEYHAYLERHFGSERVVIVEDLAVLKHEMQGTFVYISGSNRSDKNVSSALKEVVGPAFVVHIGSKYDGAWDVPPIPATPSANIIVDSLGEYNRKKARLTKTYDSVTSLASLIVHNTKMGGWSHFLSLGATGVDVALTRLMLEELQHQTEGVLGSRSRRRRGCS